MRFSGNAILCFMLLCAGLQSFAQRGKEGDYTVGTTDEILNTYTFMTVNAVSGQQFIVVDDEAMLGGAFSGPVAEGDLLLIIQLQGATVDINEYATTGFGGNYTAQESFYTNGFITIPSEFGRVTNYGNAGKFEKVEVSGNTSPNVIPISCGLRNNYDVGFKVQVVRIPRFENLTVPNATSITSPDWNGQIGGIVALEVNSILDLNSGGVVSAAERGFRGGEVDPNSNSATADCCSMRYLGSFDPMEGAEKGESIFGYHVELDNKYSRYGIGGVANGGGGGGYENCGGGGGSNIGALGYTGLGNPSGYTAIWDLESPGFGSSTSPGGGRGGYALAINNANELTDGPGNSSWGSDWRKPNGGFGGHALMYDNTRIFFGGGGGAGDANSINGGVIQGGSGGRGGGLVYIVNYGSLIGDGTISVDGENGEKTNPTDIVVNPFSTDRTGNDGAGGGGAGGWIHIENATSIPNTIVLSAEGGDGGNQDIAYGNFASFEEASGPGGSGAGGAISYTLGAPIENVNGGVAGVTNSSLVTNFPPNGATEGAPGVAGLTTDFFDIIATDTTICGSQSINLEILVNGVLPAGYTIGWYTDQYGGALFETGLTYSTSVLTADTTLWIGTCPGTFRVPLNVFITTLDDATFTSGDYCESTTNTIGGIVTPGGTFNIQSQTGSGAATIDGSTGIISNAVFGDQITIEYTTPAGSCQNSSIVVVNVTPADDATFVTGDYCETTTNTVGGIVTPGGSFSIQSQTGSGLATIDGATGVVSNAAVGDQITIEYFTPAGPCQGNSTVIVNVTPADDPAFTTGDFCEGTSNILSNIATPGGAFSIQSQTGSGLATIDGTSGVISNAIAGDQITIQYDTPAGPCQSSTTAVVNVIPLDDASFTSSDYCESTTNVIGGVSIPGGVFSIQSQTGSGLATIDGTSGVISNADAGDQVVILYTTPASACQNSSTQTVNVIAEDDPSFTMTPTCFGGTASVSGTSGGTFSFNVAPGDGATIDAGSGEVTNGTLGNSYDVLYTTAGACPNSSVQSVTAFTDLAYTETVTDENCGNGDGEIILSASGGDGGPYQYSITGGVPYSGSGTFSSLSAGIFSVSILDNSGCEVTGVINLSSTGGPTIDNIAPTDPSCPGACDGSITVSVSGGTPPYSYQWYDASNNPIGTDSPTLLNACAGDYSVEVTDAAGGVVALNTNTDFEAGSGASCDCPTGYTCNNDAGQVFDGNHPIYVPGDLGCVGGVTNYTSSLGAYSGSGYIYFYAGADNISTAPITFAGGEVIDLCVWYSGPQGSGASGQNTANSYFSFGIDGTQVGPDVLVPTNTGWTQHCFTVTMTAGNHTFQILSGGAAQYAIWFDDFTVGGSNSGGCPAFATTTLTDPVGPTLVVTDPSAVCAPETIDITDPAITAGSDAGTLTYWQDALATVSEPSPTSVSGSLYYIVLDDGTCTDTAAVNVTVNAQPSLVITDPAPVCVPGTVDLTDPSVTAGSDAGTFSYYSDANATLVYGTPATATGGNYYILLDDGICTDTAMVTVTENPAPTVSGDIDFCVGASSQLTGSGTAAAVTPWVSGDPSIATVDNFGLVTGIAQGFVDITYTDVNGCSTTVQVEIFPTCTIAASGINPSLCGGNDGQITVTGNYTSGVLTMSGDANNVINTGLPYAFTGLTAGTYTFSYVDDVTGCGSNIPSVTLTDGAAPNLTINDPAPICSGGIVDLTDPAITAGSDPGTLTYWADNLASTPISDPASVTVSGIYYIQLDNGSCPNIAPVNVVVNAQPNLVITDPAMVCSPLDVDLTQASVTAGSDVGTLTYWADIKATSSLATPSNATTGTYYIVLDNGFCSDTAAVNAVVNTLPNLVVTDPSVVCTPATVDITDPSVTAGSDAGTLTYWQDALATTPESNPSTVSNGAYYIVLNDGLCTDTAVVNVAVNLLPNLVITDPLAVCDPSTVDLTATSVTAGSDVGALTYWTDLGATVTLANANAVAVSGVYYLQLDVSGCTAVEAVNVTVNPLDDASFNLTPTCEGGTATVSGLAGGTFSFNTAPGDAAVIDGTTGTVSNGTAGATYDVLYTTNGSCPNSSNQIVTASTSDDPSFTLTATCDGATATVTGTVGGTFSFNTTPSDAATIDPTTGTITGSTGGVLYDVEYATAGACADSSSQTVTSLTIDDATFTLTPTCNGATVTVTGTSGGVFDFDVVPSDAALIDNLTGEITGGDGNATYTVIYTTTGTCPDSLVQSVTSSNCAEDVLISTAFTPNNDLNNDTWEIRNLDANYPENIVRVYNRWGNMLFEHVSTPSNPYDQNRWDGTYNGNTLPVGSYFYVIDSIDDSGEVFTGSVSILVE